MGYVKSTNEDQADRAVFKYVFHTGASKEAFQIPVGGWVRAFGVTKVGGVPHPAFWVEVDPDAEVETRTFQIVGTGERFTALSTYYGTMQIGAFVFHLYEVF